MIDILKGLDEAAACLRDETFDNCYVDYADYVNNGRDEILRLRAELKESRRLFARETDEYIKGMDEAQAENEKLRAALSELVGAASRVNMRTGTEFYTAWRAAYDITKGATIEDYSTVRAAAAALKETGDE